MPSASLIADDPNLLLVNAGMVPFKPYFLGEQTPPYARATSIQKCVRTLDIEEVGKTTRHASFFQMCGNFSFGDYFKEGAISLAWELLTRSQADGGFGFSESDLWVTVYEDDDEAESIWRDQIGVDGSRIQRRGMSDNFWSMGIPGPCGPCSEIYFDRGAKYGREGGPIADEDRYLEIWNLVFMQNLRGEGTSKDSYPILGELPAKSIDTGLGLERTAALLQGVENIYEIDTTRHILDRASEITSTRYGNSENTDVSLRVIADHCRTALMLIGDGVTPGNEGRGYVLRRMMRRTMRNMKLLGAQERTMNELMKSAVEAMGPAYPELIRDMNRIKEVAGAEEESFLQTLKSGSLIFDQASSSIKSSGGKTLPGSEVFKLHDTYGFPFDLTLEMASEVGLTVDESGFRQLMQEQRKRAKADAKAKKSGHVDLSLYRSILDSVGNTTFLGYSNTRSESVISAIISGDEIVQEADQDSEIEIILNRTPFYAEGGGQLGDSGLITLGSGAEIRIDDVQQPLPGLYIHRGQIIKGSVARENQGIASIDEERRRAISRAHTATHMVHKAFREFLGERATQAGSENAPGRFRFDFPATAAISGSLLNEIEHRVNALLIEDLIVKAEEMSQDDAQAIGAMALFGEKYGEIVRVVSVGDWARELCGGTHVSRSGELGLVKLLGESSIGAGVRRVEALVGIDAFNFLAQEHLILSSLTQLIKGSTTAELPERISALLLRIKEAERDIAAARIDQALAKSRHLLGEVERIGKLSYLAKTLEPGLTQEDLRTIALGLRKKLQNCVIVLASITDEKVALVVTSDDGAIAEGIKAGDLVRSASKILGGGGGGKNDFAQGGGPLIDQLSNALKSTRAPLEEK